MSYNDPQHCTDDKNLLSLLGFETVIIQLIVYSVYRLCCPGSKMCQNVNVYIISVMAFWGPMPHSLILLLRCHTSVSLLFASSSIKVLYRANFAFFFIPFDPAVSVFLLASLAILPYRYLTIPYIPHFYPQEKDYVLLRFVFYIYLLYWLLLIFQNWKFTVGISKGHWLVTLS